MKQIRKREKDERKKIEIVIVAVDATHEMRGEKIYRRIMHVLLNAGYYNISTW